ncbi:MAG: hypothetical protein ACHQ1H_03735 [Nitrososphaerales archaeon]
MSLITVRSVPGLLRWYLDNRFHLIKIEWYDSSPSEELHNEALDYEAADDWLKRGGNIGAACGPQSNGLIAFVIDARPHYSIKNDLAFYRSFGTLVNFSRYGFQVIYRTDDRERAEMFFSNFYDLKADADSVRFSNEYVVLPPSKVDGKFYSSLDEGLTPIKQIGSDKYSLEIPTIKVRQKVRQLSDS